MQIKNVLLIVQFVQDIEDGKNRKKTKLHIKLTKHNQDFCLPSFELFEDESFYANAQKEVWKMLSCEKFNFIKGSYYDEYETRIGERIIQCSNVCLMQQNVPLDNSWYEVAFSKDEIVLKNNTESINIRYAQTADGIIIVSSNLLLSNNHTPILIDALIKLKNVFCHTDIFKSYVNQTFDIADLISILGAFSTKTPSKAIIKKRFRHYIEKVNDDDNRELYQLVTL